MAAQLGTLGGRGGDGGFGAVLLVCSPWGHFA